MSEVTVKAVGHANVVGPIQGSFSSYLLSHAGCIVASAGIERLAPSVCLFVCSSVHAVEE